MMEANEIATRAPILKLHPASPHENVTQQCLSVCVLREFEFVVFLFGTFLRHLRVGCRGS